MSVSAIPAAADPGPRHWTADLSMLTGWCDEPANYGSVLYDFDGIRYQAHPIQQDGKRLFTAIKETAK